MDKKWTVMDGQPEEFYPTFWPTIKPLFIEVDNSAPKTHTFPWTMYLSTISVIAKPGRDCDKRSDFRPLA